MVRDWKKFWKGVSNNGGQTSVADERVYDVKVGALDLSVRSANCLRNEGIEYLGQLIGKTSTELLRTPNFGKRSLEEIRESLWDKYRLDIGMTIEYVPPEQRTESDSN